MTSRCDLDATHAIVVSEKDVRKIWDVLASLFGETKVEAKCGDGIERTFFNVDDFLKYENTSSKKILNVRMAAVSATFNEHANISLGFRYGAPVSLSLNGSEDLILKARDALSDVFSEMRPWYSFVAKIDLFYIFFPFFAICMLLLQLMTGSEERSVSMGFEKAVYVVAVACVFIFCVSIVIFALSKLKARLFPVVFFSIGRGVDRYRLDENLRWIVVIGFFVSAFASIVVTLMF